MFAHRPRRDGRRGGGGRVRPGPAGPSSPRTSPTCARSRRRPSGPGPRRSRSSTPSSAWRSTSSVEPPLPRAGGGGLSGPALHPVAVRAVFDCRRGVSRRRIVGVGGVSSGRDAVELLIAGANAVQVGTATFRDPRAPWRVLDELDGGASATTLPRSRAGGEPHVTETFRARLADGHRGADPLCAGIDPSPGGARRVSGSRTRPAARRSSAPRVSRRSRATSRW